MPGTHSEWAFRISGKQIPQSPTGKWKLYAIVRVEKTGDAKADSAAFGAGVYDNAAKRYPIEKKISARETKRITIRISSVSLRRAKLATSS